jgi:hypothetical protein
MVAAGMAVAVSSLGIVRVERVTPEKSKTYKCSSGTSCVEANSTGSSTWGVYGTGTNSDASTNGLCAIDELNAYRQLADFYTHHLGYAVEMANRPQTLYGLLDSPIGLAA